MLVLDALLLSAAANGTNATAANAVASATATAASLVPGSLLSEILIVAGIFLVIFILLKVGKFLFKFLFSIIANSILGIVAVFALNYWLGMGLPYKLDVLLPAAIFGLPGVGTVILMRLFGAVL
jgi:hypothetical protein